jgi:hypothetical protein
MLNTVSHTGRNTVTLTPFYGLHWPSKPRGDEELPDDTVRRFGGSQAARTMYPNAPNGNSVAFIEDRDCTQVANAIRQAARV